jgi:hypothetical protein
LVQAISAFFFPLAAVGQKKRPPSHECALSLRLFNFHVIGAGSEHTNTNASFFTKVRWVYSMPCDDAPATDQPLRSPANRLGNKTSMDVINVTKSKSVANVTTAWHGSCSRMPPQSMWPKAVQENVF